MPRIVTGFGDVGGKTRRFGCDQVQRATTRSVDGLTSYAQCHRPAPLFFLFKPLFDVMYPEVGRHEDRCKRIEVRRNRAGPGGFAVPGTPIDRHGWPRGVGVRRNRGEPTVPPSFTFLLTPSLFLWAAFCGRHYYFLGLVGLLPCAEVGLCAFFVVDPIRPHKAL